MKLIDLTQQYHRLKPKIDAALSKVLEHGQYIMGPEVKRLELKLASYLDLKYCVACSNGSDALVMALLALGIGRGDEVITTPFSFFASAASINLVGARPVFIDIEPDTFNIDCNLIESAITDKTKAIMSVSLFGQCSNHGEIERICKKNNLFWIEDAAQSFGATYKNVQSGGSATISCTSFFPTKPLGCFGDGGAVFTNDDKLSEILVELRNHGQSAKYEHTRIGLNARLDSLQAAILLEKLNIFDEERATRQKIARRYDELLGDIVVTPKIAKDRTSAYAQYTIRVQKRDELADFLRTRDIPSAVHYPRPLHLQPAFSYLGYQIGDLNEAERASREVLSLPAHPFLVESEQDEVVVTIKEFYS